MRERERGFGVFLGRLWMRRSELLQEVDTGITKLWHIERGV